MLCTDFLVDVAFHSALNATTKIPAQILTLQVLGSCLRSSDEIVTRKPPTDKPGNSLDDVATRTKTESFLHYFGRRFLAHE